MSNEFLFSDFNFLLFGVGGYFEGRFGLMIITSVVSL